MQPSVNSARLRAASPYPYPHIERVANILILHLVCRGTGTRDPRTPDTTLTPPEGQYGATQVKAVKRNRLIYAEFASLCKPALGDRQSGKLLGLAFWESEEALRATEGAVSSVRSGAAEAAGGTVAGVEQYEVFVYEAPSAGPVSGVTDTVGGTISGATGSVRGVTDNLLGGGEKQQR